MKRDPYFTWVEVGGVERDKEKGWKRRCEEEEEKRSRRRRRRGGGGGSETI